MDLQSNQEMKSILIIGDSCRDVFLYCECKRMAPDYPIPIVHPVGEAENGGMAQNVYRNIRSLHENCALNTNPNWHSITKTRYIHEESNHMWMRVDSPDAVTQIDRSTLDLNYDIIVIADYNKGFLSEGDIQYICDSHPCVFVDTKKILGPWINGAKWIKINNYEYTNSSSKITPELNRKIIHTQGGKGCSLNGKQYPTTQVQVKDSSGAGDSFMAGLVVEYAKSENIELAIYFANKCAAKVVTERGVTII